jgi:hypothetical protein
VSWTHDNEKAIRSLVGHTIQDAIVVEMALVEGADGQPIYRLAQLPFVQAFAIELIMDNGAVAHFSNYQNDDTFGISVSIEDFGSLQNFEPSPPEDEIAIYRHAPDGLVPTGKITAVKIEWDEKSDVTQVELEIAGHRIVMKAGEVYQGGRTLVVAEQDESILYFASAADLQSVRFSPFVYAW